MAKVVNQNDLKDVINSSINIIKSSVMFASDVANIVSTLPSIGENDIKKIQNVSNNIKSIVSYLDVSKIILNILNEYGNRRIFDPLLKLKMKLVIKRSINAIDILIQEISKSLNILSDDIIEKMDKLKKSETFKNLTNLFDIYKLISDVKLSSVYDPKILIKQRLMIRRIMSILSHIVQSVKGIFENPKNKIDDNLIKKMNIIIEIIDKIKSIDKIKIGLFITIKLKLLKKSIKIINDIVIECSKINLKHLKSADQKIGLIKTILNGLTKIFIEAILISPLTVLVPLALFSISLSLLSLKFLIWSINSITNVKKSIQIKLKILAITSVLTLLSSLFILSILITPIAVAASSAMLILIGSIYLIYLGIKSISLIARSILKGKTILLLTAILGALTIVMLLLVGISFIVQYIEWVALGKALLLFVVVLGILGVIMFVLVKFTTISISLIGVFGISIAIIIGILIGMLSIFTIILGAQKIILEIQNITINKKLLLQKIEDLFGIVFSVVGLILTSKLGKSGDGTFIKLKRTKRLLNKINKVFDKLVGVARSLTELSKITIPNNVLDKIQFLFNVIFGEDDGKSFAIVPTISKMEELVEKRKTTRKAKRLLGQVCGITEQLANIVKNLNDITKFDIKQDLIQNGIIRIFDLVKFVEKQVDENLIKTDANATERAKRRALRQNKRKMRQATKALGKADEVLLEIDSIVESFNKIKDYKVDSKAIETTLSGIFADVGNFIQMVDQNTIGNGVDLTNKNFENKLNVLERVSNIIKGFVPDSSEFENHKNFIENNIKLFDKINTIDIEKLKTTESLFSKMADFAESIDGNFESLAETLNEKIAPLLEELKKIMDGVGQKVEKSGANTSASIFAANQQSLSTNEMHQQVDRQLPNGTDEQKEKLVQQMMEKQAQQQTNSIISKLEDFIQVFKSGQYSEARL